MGGRAESRVGTGSCPGHMLPPAGLWFLGLPQPCHSLLCQPELHVCSHAGHAGKPVRRHWGELGKAPLCACTGSGDPGPRARAAPRAPPAPGATSTGTNSPWAARGGETSLAPGQKGNVKECPGSRATPSWVSCMPFPRRDSIIIAVPNKSQAWIGHCAAWSVCGVCGVCFQPCHSINQEDCSVFPPQPGSVSSGRNQLRCSFSLCSLLPCPVPRCPSR